MNTIIDIEHLRRRFGSCEAVNDLTVSVPEGSVFALLGPNGAGKTTTIKVMMNIIRPSGGSVKLLGVDSRKLGPRELRLIGYVSENQEIPTAMTVQQLLDYCRPLYPSWDTRFAADLVRMLDVPLDRRIGVLSRGQRMKAALVSSLAYRPRLLVLDEPFAGLDPLVREEFAQGVLELTGEERQWTVFIASHDVDEVERLADHVAMINNGRLLLSEPVSSLLARFRQVEVVRPDEAPLPSALPSSWLSVQQAGRTVRFCETAYAADDADALVRRVFPATTHAAVEPMSLRSIFVALAKANREKA
ncbi:MAG: ABC transporter ATP-binding protein [Bacteroidales bacterium]